VPQGPHDVSESHPYFFSAGQGARQDLPVFRFGEMPGMDKVPRLHPAQKELDLMRQRMESDLERARVQAAVYAAARAP
jgi:hypothetical protein